MVRTVKKPDERKAEFVATAEALFMERGFENTSVSDIVKEVGVAHGLFYHYFDSKEQILDAITEKMLVEGTKNLQKIVDDKTMDAPQKLRAFILSIFDLKRTKTYLTGYLMQQDNVLLFHKYIQASTKKMVPQLARIVEQGNREGHFNTAYPEQTVAFLFHGMRFLTAEYPNILENPHALRRMLHAISDIWERMLGTRRGMVADIYQHLEDDVVDMVAEAKKFGGDGKYAR
jgi:AcrR family transcriptional regulator